ncbi:MAG: 23S rRNA (uracil(1939)-C(5))-methyltransferase RlmD [Clostridia bacterium]|nr:23S rRNA (uracil(1939)-C(5))-methyltransferase RlmD [Clostridia bacterium]
MQTKGKTGAAAQKRGRGNGCPLYKKCGGCQLNNMTYEEQIAYKLRRVISLVGKFGHVSDVIAMENPFHYRCKVQAAFGQGRSGIISGVYQSSTHKIVPVDDCAIEDETADRIIVTVRRLAESFKLKPFCEDTMRGFLRHVLVRRGCATGQVLVVLVTATAAFPKREAFLHALCERHPEITSVVQSVNPHFTSLVLGDEMHVLYGDGFIEDKLLGLTFRISPSSFFQVNPRMTEILYKTAIDCLELSGSERVVDAYCGTGTIGMLVSPHAGEVFGVEQNGDAVRDAIAGAKRNKLSNIRFFKADAGKFMLSMAQEGERADAVILDPPRAGSDARFLRCLCTLAPKKVVYISCNPETLARDLMYLVKHGYKVKKIQPVDMFPHTEHIETIVRLSRSDINS